MGPYICVPYKFPSPNPEAPQVAVGIFGFGTFLQGWQRDSETGLFFGFRAYSRGVGILFSDLGFRGVGILFSELGLRGIGV